MLEIGVTGGIGSGKTTVCKVFESLGIPVFNADLEAREIVNSDHKVISAIKKLLGDVYKDGTMDRKTVAAKVFGNESLLNELNAIVHPAVRNKYAEWVKSHAGAPYVIREAAILFESGSAKDMDKVIVVSAPEPVRIKRVMDRDGVTEEEVKSRMARQLSEEERLRRADYVIQNDGNQMIIPQVMELHRKLIQS